MAGKFVVRTGKDGKHYFVLKAGNGEPILQSQGYNSKQSCMEGIESVRRNAAIESRFEFKQSKDGQHFFSLNASNGQQVGRSELYKSASSCENGAASVARNAPDAPVDDSDLKEPA